jgi:hypothetical protein
LSHTKESNLLLLAAAKASSKLPLNLSIFCTLIGLSSGIKVSLISIGTSSISILVSSTGICGVC